MVAIKKKKKIAKTLKLYLKVEMYQYPIVNSNRIRTAVNISSEMSGNHKVWL